MKLDVNTFLRVILKFIFGFSQTSGGGQTISEEEKIEEYCIILHPENKNAQDIIVTDCKIPGVIKQAIRNF